MAHDHQAQVMKYITEDLQLINSYDTWHGELYFSFTYILCVYRNFVNFVYIHVCFLPSGTKNVAKQMKKITCGAQKTEGNTWFLELSDKRMFLPMSV